MIQVRLGSGESFESMLKRFNRRVQISGILSYIRRHEYFEKPSIKRRKKQAIKRRKSMLRYSSP
ncbi:MAG: 30S ribosomal protein S21 [Chloroflexota bacterium]